MKLIKFFLVLFFIGLCFSHPNAEIYTWTDDNGVKHFSNQPPADVEDAEVHFREYQYDQATDQKRFDIDQKEFDKLIREIEADEAREATEQKRNTEQASRNRVPTQDEAVDAEKQRLEKKIEFLEQQPLDYFGSFKNKRVRIGYYRYRLETLMRNPDEYFKKPGSFEGNVKNVDESGSSN